MATHPFENFLALSDWIYQKTGKTHAIALERLFRLVFAGMTEALALDKENVRAGLLNDFDRTGIRRPVEFLLDDNTSEHAKVKSFRKRQQRH